MGVTYLFNLAFIASAFLGLGHGISIETSPEKIVSTMTKSATISCIPDDVNGDVKSVETIEVTKDGDKLAMVRLCPQPDCTLKSASNIEVEGAIGSDASQSFLKVTISDPAVTDTGKYTCNMNYLDQSDLFKEDKNETMLEVEELTAESLEPALDNLTKRVEMLEAQGGGPGSFQNPECVAGFAVTNKKSYFALRNTVMVLPDVQFMQGTGYDVKTGIFTAPCAGLYSFHLTVALAGKMSAAIVQLMKNTEVVFRIYAADKSYDDQSAASSAVYLEKGDTITAFVEAVTGSRIFDSKGYTLFSGYLVMRVE